MPSKVTESTLVDYGLTTSELAGKAKVKNQTIRKRLCETGSYFGLVPERLPNDRLIWPADSIERLRAAPHVVRVRPTPNHLKAVVAQ